MRTAIRFSLLFPIFFLAAATTAQGQDYPVSPVYRDYRPQATRQKDGKEGLRKQISLFLLERDAANGDPLAQQELGVRYLTGKGVKADTVKSAEWLRLAASQGLIPAMYNFALLLHNGWGVEWNPFDAYRLFFAAATAGMPEAQYVVGIFHTDDLVLRQDWETAYTWINAADQAGYAPAARAKAEIIRRGHIRLDADSLPLPRLDAGEEEIADAGEDDDDGTQVDWAPVLLDFSQERSTTTVTNAQLLAELYSSFAAGAADSLRLRCLLAGDSLDADTAPVALQRLRRMAAYTNPEAMVLLGRLYEEGRLLPADRLHAASLLGSAVYLESARAARMLIEMLRQGDLLETLPAAAYGGSAEARYLWAILRALDFDPRLTQQQALDMLERAARQGHTHALLQLGICYATGRWVAKDSDQAHELWGQAAAMGSVEARIRLAADAVFGRGSALTLPDALQILEEAGEEGSMLAAVALAATYESGIGRSRNAGESVRRYRECAIRGSQTAYRALRRMHEELRPGDVMFRR